MHVALAFTLINPPEGVSFVGFVVAISLAVIITGIAKAGFGGGIGILAVPLTIAVLPANQALGFMLPILMVGDVLAWGHHRGNHVQPYLRWMLTGAVGGVLAATVVLLVAALATGAAHAGEDAGHASAHATETLNRVLNGVVGFACIAIVGAQVYRLAGGPLPRIPATPIGGYGTGAVAGFVSTIAHSAGPVANIYLLERGLDKKQQTGTAVMFFLVLNAVKVPAFVLLTVAGARYFEPGTLLASLVFIPLVPVGTLAGWWMHHRVPERPFAVIMYAGATAGAGWMIFKAFS